MRDDASAVEASRRLRQATERPVLTELTVRGSAVRAVAPTRARDVLAGQTVVLAIELDPSGGTIEARGHRAGSSEPWLRRLDLPAAGASSTAVTSTPIPLGALYGREAAADAEMRLTAHPDDAERIDLEIEAIGMRHRIATRRTSLVAIADEPSVDPRQPRRRERLPVELPAGVSAEGVGLAPLASSGITDQVFLAAMPEMAVRGPLDMLGGTWGKGEMPTVFVPRPRRRKEEPRHVDLGDARVLHADGPLVVVEFEVPEDGLDVMPYGDVRVSIAGAPAVGASVVREESSPKGPHARGRTVRLALALEEKGRWPDQVEIEVSWAAQRDPAVFSLRLSIPLSP